MTVYTYIPRSKLVASNAGKPTVGEEVGRDQPSPTVLRGEAARLSALSSCRAVDSREYTVAGNRRRVWHCTDRVVVWVWSCGRNGYGAAASRFTLGRWYRIPTWVGPWTTSVGCVVRRVSVVRSLGGSTTPDIYIYLPERYAVHSVESHFKNLQNQCSRKPNRRSSIVDRMRICIRVFS